MIIILIISLTWSYMIHYITTTPIPLCLLHATEADLKGQFDDISAAAQIDKAAVASLMAK